MVVLPDDVWRIGGTEKGSRPVKFCAGGTVGCTVGDPVGPTVGPPDPLGDATLAGGENEGRATSPPPGDSSV